MQYELFYLVGQNNEDKMGEIRAEIEKILSEENALIHEIEVINKRKLSYEIKHQIKGIYVARRFDMPENDYWAEEQTGNGNDSLQRIINKLNLMPNLLRFIVVKADELPELKQKEVVAPAKKEFERKDRREKTFIKNEQPKSAPVAEKKAEESIDKKLEEILNI